MRRNSTFKSWSRLKQHKPCYWTKQIKCMSQRLKRWKNCNLEKNNSKNQRITWLALFNRRLWDILTKAYPFLKAIERVESRLNRGFNPWLCSRQIHWLSHNIYLVTSRLIWRARNCLEVGVTQQKMTCLLVLSREGWRMNRVGLLVSITVAHMGKLQREVAMVSSRCGMLVTHLRPSLSGFHTQRVSAPYDTTRQAIWPSAPEMIWVCICLERQATDSKSRTGSSRDIPMSLTQSRFQAMVGCLSLAAVIKLYGSGILTLARVKSSSLALRRSTVLIWAVLTLYW